MTTTRMYRQNVTLLLVEPEAFADRNAPTSAELNDAVGGNNWTGGLVHNITCALWEDDTEFTLGDPETDTGLTFCTDAGFEIPVRDNPTVTYTALRDFSRLNATTTATADGVFNKAFELLAWPDRAFVAVHRIGKDSDVAFAMGDIVQMVAVKTAVPNDVVSNGENIRIQNQFLPQGWINWNYTLAS